MFCQRCGTQNPGDARFCGSCGQPLAAPPPGAPVQAAPPSAPPQPAAPSAAAPPYQPPPPIPPQYAPPPAPPPQYSAPPQSYAPPQYNAPPQFAPPPMYTDGNTSGSGQVYPAPSEAAGFSAAGCVPFGIFAFANGITVWGVVGLILGLIGAGANFSEDTQWIGLVSLVYIVYICTKGKELAWRSRRFPTVAQYVQTMRVWNGWGWLFFVLGLIWSFISIGMMAENQMPGDW